MLMELPMARKQTGSRASGDSYSYIVPQPNRPSFGIDDQLL